MTEMYFDITPKAEPMTASAQAFWSHGTPQSSPQRQSRQHVLGTVMPLKSLRFPSQTFILRTALPECCRLSVLLRARLYHNNTASTRSSFLRRLRNCLAGRLKMVPPPVLQTQYMSSGTTPKKSPEEPRPSASILLISPSNQILLLHRVRTSSTFPSAHVFPGGYLSAKQDGEIPGPKDPRRHQDGLAYRLGAIRECFEESGILLARRNDGSGAFLEVSEEERERARKEIHAGKLIFPEWVASQGGIVDTDSLIPFTRWITPSNIPRRFTTQMYLAFLDLPRTSSSSSSSSSLSLPTTAEALIPTPTTDGGLEHTAALFAPCSEWLSLARSNSIILFPPQFYLMHLLAPFLRPPPVYTTFSTGELQAQREGVLKFLEGDGDGRGTKWADKVMSPLGLLFRKGDGRSVLGLERPGPELVGSGRVGDWERVVLVRFSKEGPRDVEVRLRSEVLAEEKSGGGMDGKL